MNLILTSSCNKNCSFCFANEYVKNPEEEIFNIDFVKELLTEAAFIQGNNVKYSQIKLLGGEPTMYPHFKELMRWLIDLGKERYQNKQPMLKPCLVSNFLFTDNEIGELIKEYSEIGSEFNFLLNTAEFGSKTQLKLFIKNIQKFIVQKKYISLTFGFTMFKNKDFKTYKDILDAIYNEFILSYDKHVLSPYIRLSMPNPENGTVDFEEVINNIEYYRNLMKDFISWGKNHSIKVHFDCGLFYCLFDDELRVYAKNWSDGADAYGCDSSALDIFPNGDVINCYPASGLFKSNYYKYNSIIPTFKEIEIKRKYYVSEKTLLPERCQKCDHYMKICKGPCLGYYKKKDKYFEELLNN